MSWSEYRKAKNAFKLHLSFELNRMIATEFLIGSGKSSERALLEKVLEAGVTYIADRGYGSFGIINKVIKAEAYFVFRVKDNLLYEVRQIQEISSGELPNCFRQVRDELIVFKSDKKQTVVRLIEFRVAGSYFRIVTNRFDLPTLKIIILYAYRWQIELFCKYLKRTLNGLHLLNHSENGVEIQFYVLMTLAILFLKFKQDCQNAAEKKADYKRNKRKKPSKSVGMDQKNERSILRIVENKQELVIDSEELNNGSK